MVADINTANNSAISARVAPRSTKVLRYSSLRLTAERGLYTLVNTTLGPGTHHPEEITLS